MDKTHTTFEAVAGLLAEMVLDEAVRKHKEQHLYREIDLALEQGDESLFLKLTHELKLLQPTMESA